MKSLIKSVLIVLCLFVVFSSIFKNGEIDTSPLVSEDINIFEENIENGNQITNDTIFEEDTLVLEGNIFGELGSIMCHFFISIITGFIKLIIELIGKIV